MTPRLLALVHVMDHSTVIHHMYCVPSGQGGLGLGLGLGLGCFGFYLTPLTLTPSPDPSGNLRELTGTRSFEITAGFIRISKKIR